ncbi:MAG TPA: DUF4215 domain-containing protein [Polyangiaceae bacterium]|nr:DUF4215 domain-containing protein [Polyangiaceae bacterium]
MQQPASSSRTALAASVVAARWIAACWVAACAACAVACSPGSSADNAVSVIQGNESSGGSAGAAGSGEAPTVDDDQLGDDSLYTAPPPPQCADFNLDADEACDDGNRDDGDGCSGNCLVVEPGYVCEPGKPCVQVEVCGDSKLELNETCDDGNEQGEDGCSANCRVENGYACPALGKPCVSTAVCGDGFVALGEECDDTNATAGDGCSDQCQIETGWLCPIPGAKCQPECGDGLVVGSETCDDGNAAAGDGCGATCRLESGFACDAPGEPCRPTDCQDGLKEGSEQCDDGNDVPYDGCTASCTNEPRCGSPVDGSGEYTCAAVCGDGMKFLDEECDDGNTLPDDGCSPTCQREDGYDCVNNAADLGDVLELPIIYRDFTPAHPQFELDPRTSPRLPGMVQAQLACRNVGAGAAAHVECKPAFDPAFGFSFNGAAPRAWTLDGSKPAADSQAPQLSAAQIATAFNQWFSDSNQSTRVISTLPLALLDDGSFQFSATGANQFFPLDELLPGVTDGAALDRTPHNFHFTSEVRQWFEAPAESATLNFTGDDDVWVFVNGQLTVDLGGIHSEITGSIDLTQDGRGSTLTVQDVAGGDLTTSTINVPLSQNSVNEIVVFQAERHVTESNYTLTLRGFNAPVTTCRSVCGNGVVTPDESCDDGPLNGTGYDRCSADCTPGPRCGDGVINGPEQCDNGFNQDAYETDPSSCAPGCVRAPHCGDGVVDAMFREQCDDGVNDGSYGGCTAECLFGPRCGDGETNGNETCDDGNRRNGDGCNINCQRERNPI